MRAGQLRSGTLASGAVHSGVLATPLGTLVLAWEAAGLVCLNTAADLAPEFPEGAPSDDANPGEPVPLAIRAALARYFEEAEVGLNLPLAARGTDFQHRVWRALQAIPPGATRTYGDLARQLGTSARAIGGACRANPCLIAVPCHRVIAKDGLGGFAGDVAGRRLEVKRWLLRHEGASTALVGAGEL
ncbi:MAG: methylated-DNA--[protein]-cysteine S-methyltransferase [Chromatiaceae bacterium]